MFGPREPEEQSQSLQPARAKAKKKAKRPLPAAKDDIIEVFGRTFLDERPTRVDLRSLELCTFLRTGKPERCACVART